MQPYSYSPFIAYPHSVSSSHDLHSPYYYHSSQRHRHAPALNNMQMQMNGGNDHARHKHAQVHAVAHLNAHVRAPHKNGHCKHVSMTPAFNCSAMALSNRATSSPSPSPSPTSKSLPKQPVINDIKPSSSSSAFPVEIEFEYDTDEYNEGRRHHVAEQSTQSIQHILGSHTHRALLPHQQPRQQAPPPPSHAHAHVHRESRRESKLSSKHKAHKKRRSVEEKRRPKHKQAQPQQHGVRKSKSHQSVNSMMMADVHHLLDKASSAAAHPHIHDSSSASSSASTSTSTRVRQSMDMCYVRGKRRRSKSKSKLKHKSHTPANGNAKASIKSRHHHVHPHKHVHEENVPMQLPKISYSDKAPKGPRPDQLVPKEMVISRSMIEKDDELSHALLDDMIQMQQQMLHEFYQQRNGDGDGDGDGDGMRTRPRRQTNDGERTQQKPNEAPVHEAEAEEEEEEEDEEEEEEKQETSSNEHYVMNSVQFNAAHRLISPRSPKSLCLRSADTVSLRTLSPVAVPVRRRVDDDDDGDGDEAQRMFVDSTQTKRAMQAMLELHAQKRAMAKPKVIVSASLLQQPPQQHDRMASFASSANGHLQHFHEEEALEIASNRKDSRVLSTSHSIMKNHHADHDEEDEHEEDEDVLDLNENVDAFHRTKLPAINSKRKSKPSQSQSQSSKNNKKKKKTKKKKMSYKMASIKEEKPAMPSTIEHMLQHTSVSYHEAEEEEDDDNHDTDDSMSMANVSILNHAGSVPGTPLTPVLPQLHRNRLDMSLMSLSELQQPQASPLQQPQPQPKLTRRPCCFHDAHRATATTAATADHYTDRGRLLLQSHRSKRSKLHQKTRSKSLSLSQQQQSVPLPCEQPQPQVDNADDEEEEEEEKYMHLYRSDAEEPFDLDAAADDDELMMMRRTGAFHRSATYNKPEMKRTPNTRSIRRIHSAENTLYADGDNVKSRKYKRHRNTNTNTTNKSQQNDCIEYEHCRASYPEPQQHHGKKRKKRSKKEIGVNGRRSLPPYLPFDDDEVEDGTQWWLPPANQKHNHFERRNLNSGMQPRIPPPPKKLNHRVWDAFAVDAGGGGCRGGGDII